MLGVFSIALVLAGASTAYASRSYPAWRLALERCGGMLLVAGLVVLGFAFPFSD